MSVISDEPRQAPPVVRKRVRVGGALVDPISLKQLLQRLDEMVEGEESNYVCFCEAHLCVRATREPEMRAIVNGASLVVPDGVSMTAGSRLLGEEIPERLPGPLVMMEYCKHGVKAGLRHYLLGGAEGVPERLAAKLRAAIPGINIVGTYSPPFRPLSQKEDLDLQHRIEQTSPDVLWVGLGAPKQEKWMAERAGRLRVPLMLGVGAAFDFHSGQRKWAPPWIRRCGLEWLYRMFTGGRRVFFRNAKYDTAFVWIIFWQTLARRLGLDGANPKKVS